MTLPYDSISIPAPSPEGNALLAHLIDGAGFRFRRATEGLTDNVAAFEPPNGAMGLQALMHHMRDLAAVVGGAVDSAGPNHDASGLDALRLATLEHLEAASAAVRSKSADELRAIELRLSDELNGNLMNLVHGPLSDFLTHVGQVNFVRRLAGNPAPPTDHFNGKPRSQ